MVGIQGMVANHSVVCDQSQKSVTWWRAGLQELPSGSAPSSSLRVEGHVYPLPHGGDLPDLGECVCLVVLICTWLLITSEELLIRWQKYRLFSPKVND